MSITIDLNHTQTDKFEESEFLHHEARVKFLTAIDTSLGKRCINTNLACPFDKIT